MIDAESGNVLETQLEILMPLMVERLNAGQSIRFSPRGVSMLPMLRQGKDSVVLSPLPEALKKFDLPLYRRDDGKFVLHRIVEVDAEYACMGDNQFVKEYGVRHEQMIALVTGFYRGNRYHSVEEPMYRLYCRWWYGSRALRKLWRRGIGFLKRKLKQILNM